MKISVDELLGILTNGATSSVSVKKLRERLEAIVETNKLDMEDPEVRAIFNMFAEGLCTPISAHLNDLCDLLNRDHAIVQSWIEKYETHFNSAMDAAAEAKSVVSDAESALHDVRRLQPQLIQATHEMESALKRYEAIKRFPNMYARSTAQHKWVCSECGTEMGKVNLYGEATGEWSRIPIYCPGCGAKTPYGEPYNDEQDIQSVNYLGQA